MKRRCKSGYFADEKECVKRTFGKISNSPECGGGVGFFGLLALLFIGLKLGNVITWSWWLVLSPIWVPVLITLVIILIFAIIFGTKW